MATTNSGNFFIKINGSKQDLKLIESKSGLKTTSYTGFIEADNTALDLHMPLET